jgi:hypothetical protein
VIVRTALPGARRVALLTGMKPTPLPCLVGLAAVVCSSSCAHSVRLVGTPDSLVVDGRPVQVARSGATAVNVDVGPAPVRVVADGVVVEAARSVDVGRVAVAAGVAVPVGVVAGSAAWIAMNAPQVVGGVLLDPLGVPQGLLAPSACTLPVAFAACIAPAVLASPFILAPPAEIVLPVSSTPPPTASTASTASTTASTGVTP